MPEHEVKFEIEYIGKDRTPFIMARQLIPGLYFSVEGKSFLNNIEIKSELIIPRALDEKGNQRYDLFIFFPVRKADLRLFEKKAIVELTHR